MVFNLPDVGILDVPKWEFVKKNNGVREKHLTEKIEGAATQGKSTGWIIRPLTTQCFNIIQLYETFLPMRVRIVWGICVGNESDKTQEFPLLSTTLSS